ncbi:MAG: hypothetical protein E7100_02845 [Bacteroidaceae bacterium]|jgi:hypothetical protein|nr:hypothetical protein [Bacteroidaceae bacterium]
MKNYQETSLAAVVSGHGAQAGESGTPVQVINTPVESLSPRLVDSPLPVHVLRQDPYAWFSERGQYLHSLSISILPKARANGVLYTGTFNIDGFIYTVGAASVEGLFMEAMGKRCRHLQSIKRHQQRKRQRCALRYQERYPAAALPAWLN